MLVVKKVRLESEEPFDLPARATKSFAFEREREREREDSSRRERIGRIRIVRRYVIPRAPEFAVFAHCEPGNNDKLRQVSDRVSAKSAARASRRGSMPPRGSAGSIFARFLVFLILNRIKYPKRGDHSPGAAMIIAATT
jgi:hypothetical protein